MRSGGPAEASLEGPERLLPQWPASASLPDTCVHSCVGAAQRAGSRLETRSHCAVRGASFFPLALRVALIYSFPEISQEHLQNSFLLAEKRGRFIINTAPQKSETWFSVRTCLLTRCQACARAAEKQQEVCPLSRPHGPVWQTVNTLKQLGASCRWAEF